MKKIGIVFLLFLFSCQSENKQTLVFLNEGIIRSNHALSQSNASYFTDVEMYIKENPQRFYEIKKETDSLILLQRRIDDFVDSIKSEIYSQENGKNLNSQDIQPFIGISPDYFKEQLERALDDFNRFIGSKPGSITMTEIKLPVESEKLTLSLLDLIRNELLETSYRFLSHKLDPFEKSSLNPNHYEAVVVPKSSFVYHAGFYEAEIGLVAIVSDLKPLVIVGNDTLAVEKGKARYVSEKKLLPGNYCIPGKIEMELHQLGQVLTFPFELNFNVLSK